MSRDRQACPGKRVFHLGLPQAVICMCTDNFVRMIWMGVHFHKGKWKTAIQD